VRALKTIRLRLRSVFRRRQVEQDLDDELRDHLERQITLHRAAGLSPADARAAAVRDFGNVPLVQEHCRDTRHVAWIEDLVRDAGYALRSMRSAPGHTAVVVLSLAFAIGANTTIFSLVNTLMLRDLPVADPDGLVELGRDTPNGAGNFPYLLFERIRDQNGVFSDVVAMSAGTLQGESGNSERPPVGRLVSGDFFDVLGIRPAVGRLLSPADDRLGAEAPSVTAISHAYWQREFGGDPGIVGRTVGIAQARAGSVPFTVVGVLPREFEGLVAGRPDDFFIPIAGDPRPFRESLLTNPGSNWLKVVGRLRPGASLEAARASVDVIWARYLDEFDDRVSNAQERERLRAQRLSVTPARTGLSELRREFSRPVLLLMGAVACVLLIACANAVNLLLARGTARSREMGVRLAIGGSRGRLIRQLLTESAALGLAGGVLGLAIAMWGSRLVAAFMTNANPTIVLDLAPDRRVLGFTAAVALGSAVLAGLAPALRFSRPTSASALQTSHAPRTSRGISRSGRALIAAQVAVSLLLLAGALLLVTTLRNLRTFEAGFDRDDVILMRLSPERAGYAGARRLQYYREALQRARQAPGIRAAGLSAFTPISGGGLDLTFGLAGEPREDGALVYVHIVSDGYFDAMGTPLLRGRDFGPQDGAQTQPVLVVNDALARRYFADQQLLGQRVRLGRQEGFDIIGVVTNAKYVSLREEDHPTAYVLSSQFTEPTGLSLVVKTNGEPQSIAAALRRDVQAVAPTVGVSEPTLLSTHIDRSLIRERLVTHILTVFSGLALLLASVGLYAVLAYAVTRRTSEIGIRFALGATRRDVLSSVLRESSMLVALGVAIGVPATLALTRMLSTLLYGVTPTDPRVLAGVVVSLFAVAIAASLVPAWRASRVNPLVALRHE